MLRARYVTMPHARSGHFGAGSIVGPWIARSYLFRCPGAPPALLTMPFRPIIRTPVRADDGGIAIAIPRGKARISAERTGLPGADGAAVGRVNDRLADFLRFGRTGHAPGLVLPTGAGHRRPGDLVRAGRGLFATV